VKPAKAKALRTSKISAPCTLSRSIGSRVASAGAPFAGARGCKSRNYLSAYCIYPYGPGTHLRRDVIVEVPSICGSPKLRTIRCRISMNVCPINTTEKWVSLVIAEFSVAFRKLNEAITLMNSAPSTLPSALAVAMKALRRA
jgi:hypothetical protein